MKKILLISSIYPGEDVPSSYTSVIHYFAREWVRMDFDVRVVHTSNYFPILYYAVPLWFRSFIASRKGFAFPEKRLNKEKTFELDGVKIYRVPMKKIIPGKAFSNKVMKKSMELIRDYLESENFVPNYIIGHWVMPQAYLIYGLKEVYECPTALILHDEGYQLRCFLKQQEIINSIDIWGFRSEKIKMAFERNFGKKEYCFRCYSGIPTYYLENVPNRMWNNINRFIYVGLLIQRKHPDKLISAVHEIYGNSSYDISIIGSGGMSVELEFLVQKLECRKHVHFIGKIERSKIVKYLDCSDVFVMISESEVFGLVYIEAMARGCIVIASKGEGMHGIIEDGVNGFLCTAGDLEELKKIINKIKSLSIAERKQISESATMTAKKFTDKNVAELYINTVIKLGETKRTKQETVRGKDKVSY